MDISLWLITLLMVLITISFSNYVWGKWKFYKLSWKLPGPFALPFLGNALHFFCRNEDIFDTAITIISKYSSPLRFWFGPQFTMVIFDAYYAEKILSSMKFATKGNVYKFLKIFLGEGLISGSGAKWKRDRKLMAPLFLKKNIVTYFPVILQHANELKAALQSQVNKNTFDIGLWLHRCTFDIVNEALVGIKSNSMDGSSNDILDTQIRIFAVIHARIIKVWLQVDWIFRKTRYFVEEQREKDKFHSFMKKAMETSLSQQSNYNQLNQPHNFYYQLMEIKKEHPEYATDEELLHHLVTLYSASEDTVMTICSFTLLLLGMYPKIQDRAIREIENIIGKAGPIKLTELDKLSYLDMCIKDILRLFPIAPFIMRTTTEECIVGNFCIPKNCSVVVAIHNIHRNPEYWEKPNEFNPDHFLPENVKKRHPYAYLPFSAGPRACTGKIFANMAIKTILVTLLRSYVIEADGDLQDIKLKTDISVRPKDHLYPIRIRDRSYR